MLAFGAEHLAEIGGVDANKGSIYRDMSFGQIEEYADVAKGVSA